MILAHIMGLPVEETVLQAIAVGTATGTTIGIACSMMLDRLLTRLEAPLMETRAAHAGSDEAAVVAAALDYFEGWFEGDADHAWTGRFIRGWPSVR